MTTVLEGLEDFTKFIDYSVEEKKAQIGVYIAITKERPYYRPAFPSTLMEGMVDKETTVHQSRLCRVAYDMIRARQRANALYERKREDYYILALRNAESDVAFLESMHDNLIKNTSYHIEV